MPLLARRSCTNPEISKAQYGVTNRFSPSTPKELMCDRILAPRTPDSVVMKKRLLNTNKRSNLTFVTIPFVSISRLHTTRLHCFQKPLSEFTKFLAAAPSDQPQRPNAVLLLADCQVRTGDYKKVIESLSPLADADPNNRTVAFLLGSALIGDGQLNQGQSLIDKVFHDDDSAQAHLLMGSILLLADDGHGAIREFERAIQLDPKLPTLNAWYGRALMRMGDTVKAKTVFRTALEQNQNEFDANLFLGVLLRQDKEFEEALTYLSRAVHLRPRDQFARYHVAAVYTSLGKPQDALPLLEGVAKEFPEFSEARVLLASVYYRLNRKEDGDREKAAVQKLTTEQQAKQPGAQGGNDQSVPIKPPDNPENDYKQFRDRR